MARRKKAPNELRDYTQESLYGLAFLWCGTWLLNNFVEANIPYAAAPAISFGLSAVNRWMPAQAVASQINRTGNSVLVNGNKVMLSAQKTIFQNHEPETEKPPIFLVKYRKDQKKDSRISQDILSGYLLDGFMRQIDGGKAPFAKDKFRMNDMQVSCCYILAGKCGQFDSYGQGSSSRLITRPAWALEFIKHNWESQTC